MIDEMLFFNILDNHIREENMNESKMEEPNDITNLKTEANIPMECYGDLKDIESKDLICTICRNVMNVPCILNPCLHKFCYSCISRWMRTELKCPLCRLQVAELNKSDNLSEYLGNLQVKCQNKECSQKIKRQNYFSHFDSCIYTKIKCNLCETEIEKRLVKSHDLVCEMRIVKCQKCSELIPYKKMEIHLKDKCPFTLVECQFCDKKDSRYIIRSHSKQCSIRKIKCMCCESTFFIEDFVSHTNICPPMITCKKCLCYIRIEDYEKHLNYCLYSDKKKCEKCSAIINRIDVKTHEC
jgi:hypothetical protein